MKENIYNSLTTFNPDISLHLTLAHKGCPKVSWILDIHLFIPNFPLHTLKKSVQNSSDAISFLERESLLLLFFLFVCFEKPSPNVPSITIYGGNECLKHFYLSIFVLRVP